MNQVSCKALRLALKITVHRNEDHKISGITLVMPTGYPKLKNIMWKYFSEEAKEYVLKQHPMTLSQLEIELL